MAYDGVLAERIRSFLASEPGLTERKMFGGLAFLVDGHMAVVASGQGGLMLRVPPERVNELVTNPAVDRVVMRGRTMTGWLKVDDAVLDATAFDCWIDLGLDYARSLPPKS